MFKHLVIEMQTQAKSCILPVLIRLLFKYSCQNVLKICLNLSSNLLTKKQESNFRLPDGVASSHK